MIGYALALLAAACVHEFIWQLAPAGLGIQGNIRAVTQWPLICAALLFVHVLAHHRFVSAVCAAVAVMSSTTAGCSAYWLISRFVVLRGQDQCSAQWSVPMLLISAVAALAVFWRWDDGKRR